MSHSVCVCVCRRVPRADTAWPTETWHACGPATAKRRIGHTAACPANRNRWRGRTVTCRAAPGAPCPSGARGHTVTATARRRQSATRRGRARSFRNRPPEPQRRAPTRCGRPGTAAYRRVSATTGRCPPTPTSFAADPTGSSSRNVSTTIEPVTR